MDKAFYRQQTLTTLPHFVDMCLDAMTECHILGQYFAAGQLQAWISMAVHYVTLEATWGVVAEATIQ